MLVFSRVRGRGSQEPMANASYFWGGGWIGVHRNPIASLDPPTGFYINFKAGISLFLLIVVYRIMTK